MTFAKILVPVTGSPTDTTALATAFTMAEPFRAHVAALFVHPDPREVTAYVYSGASVSPQLIQSIVDGQRKLADEALAAARSAFSAAAKDVGAASLPAPAKNADVTCSFESRFGFIPELISGAARFSDLVVFKPVQGNERPELSVAIADTLVKVGRPMLLSAQTPPQHAPRTVAIGWDGGTAAVHAVSAALPFLRMASKVEILTIGRQLVPGCDALREYLAVHGIEARVRHVDRVGESVASSLVEAAVGGGAELLVMGGYGHSRFRETLLGGVTLEIVSHHTLPVFLMH